MYRAVCTPIPCTGSIESSIMTEIGTSGLLIWSGCYWFAHCTSGSNPTSENWMYVSKLIVAFERKVLCVNLWAICGRYSTTSLSVTEITRQKRNKKNFMRFEKYAKNPKEIEVAQNKYKPSAIETRWVIRWLVWWEKLISLNDTKLANVNIIGIIYY